MGKEVIDVKKLKKAVRIMLSLRAAGCPEGSQFWRLYSEL